MADILAFIKTAVFLLASVSYLQILFTEARPFKPMNKHNHIPHTAFVLSEASKDDFRPTSPAFSPGVGHPKKITNSIDELSAQEFKDDNQPTKLPSALNPDVGHTPSSLVPLSQSGKKDEMLPVSAVDDFQPTPPCHSPGDGDGEIDPKPPGSGLGNGDIPIPGHSPGVGQAIIFHKSNSGETKGYQPRSSSHIPDNTRHQTVPQTPNALQASAAASKDDFRPTSPGFSPGVGHPKTLLTSSNIEKSVTGFKEDYRPTQPGHSPGVGHAYQQNNAEPNP